MEFGSLARTLKCVIYALVPGSGDVDGVLCVRQAHNEAATPVASDVGSWFLVWGLRSG